MNRTRDNIIASAHGMPLVERKDETALFERIKMLELAVSQLVARVQELEAAKGIS